MTLDGEGGAGVSMVEAARRILKDALVRAGAPARLGQRLPDRFAEVARRRVPASLG